MINVLRQELRLSRGSVLVGVLALSLIAALYLSIYPTFHQDANDFMHFVQRIPEAARKGINMQVTSILSFLGFYAFTFTMIGLAAAIYASQLGLAIFSREDMCGTMDFLLTKPHRRASIFIQKYLAGLFGLIISSAAFTLIVYVLARLVDAAEYDMGYFLMMNLALFAAQLWIYHFAAATTQVVRIKSVIGTSIGISFSFFAIGVIGAIIGEEKLRYLSPLKFFDVGKLAADGSWDMNFVIYAAITAIILLVTAFMIYVRKDIKAAV